MAARIEALEKENADARKKQRALEYDLEEQRIATERDAIERERQWANETRFAMEQEGMADEKEVSGLLKREEELTERELILEGRQNDQFERQYAYRADPLKLSDEDLALAGRAVGGFSSADAEEETVNEEDFYRELSPYGSWFESADYGYVWQPAVCSDPGWRPYNRGQWACSDRGWTWISTEPFGWATYHYGRWAYLQNGRGWIWVPGTEWAPSWCTWRESNDYLGWAPLPPSGQKPVVNPACYTFVEHVHFDHPVSRVCVPVSRNEVCLREARDISRLDRSQGRVFSGGPGYRELCERVGHRLPYYQISRQKSEERRQASVRPGTRLRGQQLVVSQPRVQVASRARTLSRPPRVRGDIESYRAPSPLRSSPRVEIVSRSNVSDSDPDLRSRIVDALMPDLSQKALEAGFPVGEVSNQEIILPELQDAALKPVEVAVVGEAIAENGREPSGRERPTEQAASQAEERPGKQGESRTSETTPQPQPAARPAPAERVATPRQQTERNDRDREEAESGKQSRPSR